MTEKVDVPMCPSTVNDFIALDIEKGRSCGLTTLCKIKIEPRKPEINLFSSPCPKGNSEYCQLNASGVRCASLVIRQQLKTTYLLIFFYKATRP